MTSEETTPIASEYETPAEDNAAQDNVVDTTPEYQTEQTPDLAQNGHAVEATPAYEANQESVLSPEGAADTYSPTTSDATMPAEVAHEVPTQPDPTTAQDEPVSPVEESTMTNAPAEQVAQEPTGTYSDPTAATVTSTPVDDVNAQHAERLQRMQEELQAAQQRLTDSKARLQAAKEHETQLQAAKEQLDAIQAELDKTQAELDQTHSRIQQYY